MLTPQNRKKRYLSKIDTRGLTAKKKGDLKIINGFEKQNDFKFTGKDQRKRSKVNDNG